MSDIPPLVTILLYLAGAALLLFAIVKGCGLVVIGDSEVGVVTKKFGFKNLETGRLVALNGESGIQVDTLPPGWHFFLWPWQYSVETVKMVIVPESEIALVIANDGRSIPDGRNLGDKIDCDNYQDGRTFLSKGGFKGRQVGKLTTGTYRINTRLFTIITRNLAANYGLEEDSLELVSIPPNSIGVVTILDGKSLSEGEIAAPVTPDHSSFQAEQKFLDNGGFRGLQQEVILPGTWSINPWFASVKIEPMTQIPVAHVGVVISFVGPAGKDVSGEDFKYGDIVENGCRGVWQKPMNPGVYPINPKTTKIEIVPTSNFVLNWSDRSETHGLDKELQAIRVQSKDGFEFPMAVQQIIHVPYDVAPHLIARFGTMENLIRNVLEPLVGNYFRNAGQAHPILEFILSRKERQEVARSYVSDQLRTFNVEGVDTLIGDIQPPAELMKTLQDRKLAEEGSATITMQMELEKKRQEKERQTALADSQRELVHSEQAVKISAQNAEAAKAKAAGEASVKITQANADAETRKITADAEGQALKLRSTNEADSIKLLASANAEQIKLTGQAEAEVIQLKTDAIGKSSYAAIEVARCLANSSIKLVPEIMLGGGGNAGPADALLGLLAVSAARDVQKQGKGKECAPEILPEA